MKGTGCSDRPPCERSLWPVRPARSCSSGREPIAGVALEDLALMRGRDNLEFVGRKWVGEDGKVKIPDDIVSAVAAQSATKK